MSTSPSDAPLEPRRGARHRYLRALAAEPVDRPPAWIMRQAGRYLPEYRALRERHSFLDSVHDPDLAAEITLQPLRRFPELDAAILFSDILTVLEAAGLGVTFPPGGPRVEPALSDLDVGRLRPVDAGAHLAYVGRGIERVREELAAAGDPRAVLGFAGAPWTLACYAVEGRGGKDFGTVRGRLHAEPAKFAALLEHLAEGVADLLVLQVEAGADAVQLFDTWAGTLAREDHARHLAPHTARIIERVHAAGGRCIAYVKDGAHLLDDLIDCGADAVGVDWRADLRAAAKACAAAGRTIQGNLDPAALFAPAEEIDRRVGEILDAIDAVRSERADGRCGHVLNLGHGILPPTPVEGVEAMLAALVRRAEGAPSEGASS